MHLELGRLDWVAVVIVVWLAIRAAAHLSWLSVPGWRLAPVIGAALVWWSARRTRAVLMTVAIPVVITVALVCGAGAWWQVTTPRECASPGQTLTAEARVVSEARPRGRGQRAVLQARVKADSVRLEAVAYGGKAARLARLRHGETVRVSGSCAVPSPRWRGYLRSIHVVATLSVDDVSEPLRPPSPMARSVNRIHDALRRGARTLAGDDRELFLGLVVGADDRQPRAMVDDFRASGLGHLTAVSGQNVAYVLALVGALGLGTAPTRRLAITLAVLVWFALLTRMEPSVVRATGAAALAAATRAVGVRPRPIALAASSIIALLLIDPMLAHSIGFLLSASAALGVVALTPPLARTLTPRLGSRRATMIAVPLAAQIATAPVAVTMFGRLPAVGMVCNLLATPVAGLVMLVGIPAALAASVLPDPLAAATMAPVAVLVRWVWWVAHVGARAPSGPVPDAVGWLSVLTLVALLGRGRVRDLRRGSAGGPGAEHAAR